jgi:hypothetical protein
LRYECRALLDGAWAILRARTPGIQIHESVEGWSAFGHLQDWSAGVDASHISELLACCFIGFVYRGSEKFVVLPEAGSKALEKQNDREISEWRKCPTSVKLEPQTY